MDVSRRYFLGGAMFVAATSAALSAREFLGRLGWMKAATAAPVDVVHDTFNGLLALVVSGPDDYLIARGMRTADPGGIDAAAVDLFIAMLDKSTPFVPSFSVVVAGVLNNVAQIVNPMASGPFESPFARLSFAERVAVFQIMDATSSLAPLGALLPLFVADFCYSEAGVFDPTTHSLSPQPVACQISNDQGVNDGRNWH